MLDSLFDPPFYETEKAIREKYDQYAAFSWEQYREFLAKLKEDKFIVLPLNEMRLTDNKDKVVVGLRHDIDLNPFKALEMLKIENEYGIRSTYFILPTAAYSGHFVNSGIVRNKGMEHLYEELNRNGAEVGIHNDLLTVMIAYKIDPFEFNQNELLFYKSLHIPIYGTSAHGSSLAKATVSNSMIFKDFAKTDSVKYNNKNYPLGQHSLNEYGYEYDATYINYNLYFSDSHGKWNDPGGFNGILKKLDKSRPGDRIEILVHPDWWGK
jgi:hypothetical protein